MSDQETRTPMPTNRTAYADMLIVRLLETMEALTALYGDETLALKSSNSKAFSAMQAEKLSLIRIYENTIAEMKYFAQEVKAMSDEKKTTIRDSQAKFAAIVTSNSAVLQTTQNAMSRVGHSIGKAMRAAAHQSNAVNYDAGGQLSSKDRKTISSGRISASA